MIRIKIILLFIFPYLFLNISGSVKILNNDALYNCSSVLCSYDKLSNIHENSKAILTELENLLFDVRDEKNVHQSENEYNKRLDLEIKFPDKKDYDDSLYLSSDQDYENEMSYMNPVPYIIINSLDTDDLKRSILNDDINELDNSEERSLANEEEIDIAFSKILQLKDQQNRSQKEKNKYSLKKFLR
ncbi:conserved Plasmodium protein, unknown function [Plasmodium chabaudi chabaudi]|uniref:Fam-b protein n=2 Tax=Plasmodium chabaudi TaxID=5825 RepID=A0A077TVS8_PLACU|nr:conserved Plasmodium protein, unknown function [Plasmodium chabaudi chabaudi]SCM25050.1 conserved Plasmodium protein, unknown function [Plasmodium chabaudi adami]SCN63040.1 conserved Plasmodium protein, unknown function [Plasmodium chabaudi adami]SCN63098.1 conserved Plasmodium protein, unknown function [Plasmodium chabaudi chabaudi]VTZ71000.1 conserved Plasmodium protein, unknown function [Plasmodium chabaudi chabaudi]|eukprot:XP_016654938.1 conserved Plasmodium protein, unknown function [Plasmodium chabaudi chabaudi]